MGDRLLFHVNAYIVIAFVFVIKKKPGSERRPGNTKCYGMQNML